MSDEDFAIAHWLLDRGADVNAPKSHDFETTTLEYALADCSLETVRCVLEWGATIGGENDYLRHRIEAEPEIQQLLKPLY